MKEDTPNDIPASEEKWKEELSADAYEVLRRKGTERAFSSPLNARKENGMYYCGGCNTPLFSSDHKFDSGTGWPSFDRPADMSAVKTEDDQSFFSHRVEVHCTKCGGHLGHVFNDGPSGELPSGKKGSGKRYCINGAALEFKKG